LWHCAENESILDFGSRVETRNLQHISRVTRYYSFTGETIMFKRFTLVALVLIVALSACSSAPTPAAPTTTQDTYTSTALDTSYEGALAVRNQLALGTLQLDGAPNAITASQAKTLLTLWRALRGTTQSGSSAQAEVNALLGQIEGTLTAQQLAAIKDLKLTQAAFQQWAAANGVTLGAGGGQPGSGAGLSPEARATRQASEGRTGQTGSGASTAVVAAVITYLEKIAQ
jgi:hypothetical protein